MAKDQTNPHTIILPLLHFPLHNRYSFENAKILWKPPISNCYAFTHHHNNNDDRASMNGSTTDRISSNID